MRRGSERAKRSIAALPSNSGSADLACREWRRWIESWGAEAAAVPGESPWPSAVQQVSGPAARLPACPRGTRSGRQASQQLQSEKKGDESGQGRGGTL